jgi:uncharacterized protein (UPF0276 family)
MQHTKKNNDVFPSAGLPPEPVGIGLRSKYYEDIESTTLHLGWLEIHPENYFGGGVHRHFLEKARKNYQISFHSVGLSLGSDQLVDENHLRQIKELIDIYDPFHVSDHASWSMSGNAHLNDLLPLPYTQEVLDRLARNVDQTQNYFGRTMLVENPSTYIDFDINEMSEFDFMNRLSEMTGCHMLLDINNIFVQARNHGFDPYAYLDAINAPAVKQMHLAGHIEKATSADRPILIDTHSQPVRSDVWDLYRHAIKRFGTVHTLIEWDQDLPPLDVLVAEADKARLIITEEARKHAA